MQKQIASLPGYCVFEYLLVITPHKELRDQVLAIKKEFAGKYKTNQPSQAKPHLTLVHFFAYQMAEERLVNRIGAIAGGLTPFKIELSGFGSFPSHTIYANVTTRLPIQEVGRQLKAATPLMTLNKDHKPHFIEESHLTICRKLKPWQYEQAWLEYSHRHFSGRFIADGLTMLRRPAGETGYQPLLHFAFQSLAVHTRQGNLFL